MTKLSTFGREDAEEQLVRLANIKIKELKQMTDQQIVMDTWYPQNSGILIATCALLVSSKRLDTLTKVLIFVTLVLISLTAALLIAR